MHNFQMVKGRVGNDRYSERGMQTINFSSKFKQIQTEPINKEVSFFNVIFNLIPFTCIEAVCKAIVLHHYSQNTPTPYFTNIITIVVPVMISGWIVGHVGQKSSTHARCTRILFMTDS